MAISVFQIFKRGIGPSSTHTVGPMRAANHFIDKLKQRFPDYYNISKVKVELLGSLALTGRGHGIDKAIILGLMGEKPESVDTNLTDSRINQVLLEEQLNLNQRKLIEFRMKDHIIFRKGEILDYHPNAMTIKAFDQSYTKVFHETYYSVGGGFIVTESEIYSKQQNIDTQKFPHQFKTWKELSNICETNQISIADVVRQNEASIEDEEQIEQKLQQIWETMQISIQNGFQNEGILPGPLKVERRAPSLKRQLDQQYKKYGMNLMSYLDWVSAYALAVSEENAAGGRIVTAPTNGSAGIIPAVLSYYDQYHSKFIPNKHHDFLLTSAAIAMLIKQGASISGTEGGCQAEIGSACSMAAAGLTAALGGSIYQVENAAEIALEHNLGLTCDPVFGLVQVPCIERNTMGAVKAINATCLALHGTGTHTIHLDTTIKVLKKTGQHMKTKYKETSQGGLAAQFADKKQISNIELKQDKRPVQIAQDVTEC